MVAQNLCDWSINVWFNLMLTLQEDFHDYDQEEETEQPRDLVWNQMRLKKKKKQTEMIPKDSLLNSQISSLSSLYLRDFVLQ